MAASLLILLLVNNLLDQAVSAPQSLTNSYLPPPVEPKCRLETRTVEQEVVEEVCSTVQVSEKVGQHKFKKCAVLAILQMMYDWFKTRQPWLKKHKSTLFQVDVCNEVVEEVCEDKVEEKCRLVTEEQCQSVIDEVKSRIFFCV